MTGGACIDVEEPIDWDVVFEKARRQEFTEFIPTCVEYDDEDWEFEKVE